MSEGGPDARLTGWGRNTGSAAHVRRADDLADLRSALAAAPGRGLLPRGLGRSYGDAAQNAGGLVLDRWEPDAAVVVDPEHETATVTAGTSIGRVLRELLPAGWTVPVLPGTRFVTIGGAVAADVHGKNHHQDGSFGRWVRRLTLMDGCGEIRELGPGTDGDAFWATIGGLGLTGVVLDVTVRLSRVTTSYLRVRTRRFERLDDALDAMVRSTARYHVAWVDASDGRHTGRAVLDEAEHAQPEELPRHRRRRPLAYHPRPLATVPPLPVNLVQPAAIRAFNALWWAKAPTDRTRFVPASSFFHPLDGVRHWNRLYGPRGFLQWQSVVPATAEATLETSLRRLVDNRTAPSLVVLKRFGDGTPGPLSFPMPGWTLAADVAADESLGAVLDRMDEDVLEAGGRVYLAKDSRLRPESVPLMYPRLEQWRDTRRRLDPMGVFRSDLSRRLGLC